MDNRRLLTTLGLSSLLLLASCGGSSSSSDSSSATTSTSTSSSSSTLLPTGSTSTGAGGTQVVSEPMTPKLASRFLAQASFGPTSASIDAVSAGGAAAWINAQFAKPQTLHRTYMDKIQNSLTDGSKVGLNQIHESFWQQAAGGEDQLRQRVTFALSQIYVVSVLDGTVVNFPRGVASYYDMLGQYAFGNFRQLLEGVALHPMMGIYLSHLRNQKESGSRVPDENFGREIMQLMSIGLYQLNPDGTVKTNGGKPIETYTHDDVSGMAKVFTGWSWYGPDKTNNRFAGGTPDPDRDWKPMQNYPAMHSTSEKRFLGTTISGATSGEADLKVALDTLFNHPNVGPFIGRQLIQRLVMSNPSPAYVGRVAAAFADNGAGVRGDMKAVLRAILLDSEARAAAPRQKVREPVLRLANWMRAFNAKSASSRFLLGNQDDPLTALGQTSMRSPSVFNFYRPAYVPPNTSISAAGMVAPEMQIVAEPSVTGYLNYMQEVIWHGTGNARDIAPNYQAELALADTPAKLVDRIDLLLLNGGMSSTLRNQIVSAVNSVPVPASNGGNAAAITAAKSNRVYLTIFLAMASPEYIVQK